MNKAKEMLEKYPLEETKKDESKVDPALTKLVGETDPDTILKISRQVKRLNAEDFNAVVEALENLRMSPNNTDEAVGNPDKFVKDLSVANLKVLNLIRKIQKKDVDNNEDFKLDLESELDSFLTEFEDLNDDLKLFKPFKIALK
jgi:hypothetical protein